MNPYPTRLPITGPKLSNTGLWVEEKRTAPMLLPRNLPIHMAQLEVVRVVSWVRYSPSRESTSTGTSSQRDFGGHRLRMQRWMPYRLAEQACFDEQKMDRLVTPEVPICNRKIRFGKHSTKLPTVKEHGSFNQSQVWRKSSIETSFGMVSTKEPTTCGLAWTDRSNLGSRQRGQ